MIKLWSPDNSALVLARSILLQDAKTALQIYLGRERPEDAYALSDYRIEALNTLTSEKKRLAVISDFTEDLTLPEGVVSIKAELLDAFADRGLSDTVEFRRLARKYLRPVRHANCKVALFFSPICAEEKTQKILKQILGTQIKPVFLTEFIPAELFAPAEKQSIEIFTAKNTERVHAEAEKFLRMKLGKGAISNI